MRHNDNHSYLIICHLSDFDILFQSYNFKQSTTSLYSYSLNTVGWAEEQQVEEQQAEEQQAEEQQVEEQQAEEQQAEEQQVEEQQVEEQQVEEQQAEEQQADIGHCVFFMRKKINYHCTFTAKYKLRGDNLLAW